MLILCFTIPYIFQEDVFPAASTILLPLTITNAVASQPSRTGIRWTSTRGHTGARRLCWFGNGERWGGEQEYCYLQDEAQIVRTEVITNLIRFAREITGDYIGIILLLLYSCCRRRRRRDILVRLNWRRAWPTNTLFLWLQSMPSRGYLSRYIFSRLLHNFFIFFCTAT